MSEAVERARSAVAQDDWLQAFDLLAAADADGQLPSADLPMLGEVAYAAGHLDVAITAWERAHAAAMQAGDQRAAAAAAIFAGSGHDASDLFKAAVDGQLKAFALPGTLTLAGQTLIEPTESRNVVARLDGSDPSLGREFIAYTAHLDHIGVGAAVNGDSIYNGAMDNALGVSIMLEAAKELAGAATKPKRSLLFIALTGEEKGLLGAEWFASHPTVPKTDVVANINMDMPVLLAPSKDVVPIGLEHSTLKTALDTAAK